MSWTKPIHIIIILFTHIARCPGRLSLVEKYTGHVLSRVRTCLAPWGMSTQEHTFTFCQIFFISGGNHTLITCIQYTTMATHSECELSQSWRTQFSSHGALNLNRAVMLPLPLNDAGRIRLHQDKHGQLLRRRQSKNRKGQESHHGTGYNLER